LQFNVPKLPETEILHQAELRFRTRSNGRISVLIKKGDSVIRKFLLVQKPISMDYDIIFDVTKQLSPWINGHHGNITIEIRRNVFYIKNRGVKKSKKHSSAAYKENAKEAILILFSKDSDFLKKLHKEMTTDSARNSAVPVMNDVTSDVTNAGENILSRKKRASNKRRQSQKRLSNKTSKRKKICQVRDFEVDFNQIGWGQWIIIPKRFNSKICQGSCPAPIDADLTPTNHALLQSLMRVGNRKKGPPMPCCVPTKFKPLSMLYYEKKEVVVRYHEDMIVDKCGCR